jgi:hypothetical protein
VKADLRSEHDLGEIVGFAYRLYAANFAPLFLIALLVAPPQMLAVVAERQIEHDITAQNVAALIQLFVALVTIVVAAALVAAIHDATGGTPPAFGRALDAAMERLGALLTTALLFAGLIVAALVAAPALAVYWLIRRDATIDGRRNWWLAVLPGALFVYLAVRWAFTLPAQMIDGRRNWSALDLSADVVRCQWWRTLAVILVVSLIAAGPPLIAEASALAAPLVEATVTSAASALVLPFAVAAQALLYYDLKARSAVDIHPPAVNDPRPDVPREGA